MLRLAHCCVAKSVERFLETDHTFVHDVNGDVNSRKSGFGSIGAGGFAVDAIDRGSQSLLVFTASRFQIGDLAGLIEVDRDGSEQEAREYEGDQAGARPLLARRFFDRVGRVFIDIRRRGGRLRKCFSNRFICCGIRLGRKGVLCANRVLCLLYTSPSPRDRTRSRMPSSA